MGAKQTRDKEGLTDLERRFATYYLESFNATDAYMKASPRKVTERTAEVNGYRLLQNPKIRAYAQAQRDKLMNEAELSVSDVLTKLRQLLMYDVRKLVNSEGHPLNVQDLPDDIAHAVVGIDVVSIGNAELGLGAVRKYKLADKVSVLEKAMKYHGLFERDNAQQSAALKKVLENGIEIKLVRPDAD